MGQAEDQAIWRTLRDPAPSSGLQKAVGDNDDDDARQNKLILEENEK